MEVIGLNQVSLCYAEGAAVLRGVNLSLPSGVARFITGPSGAGKSSLLRLLYLAEHPSTGRVRLFGEDPYALTRVERQRLRRRLGVVFQDFRLIPHISVLENVALPLRLSGMRPRDVMDHVRELLAWVGLGDHMHALPAALSGGQQQRAAIARAIVHKPALLLADEPTGNMDEASAERLLHLFTELHKMGTAILIATHDQELMQQLDWPRLYLAEGRLLTATEAEVAA